MNLSLLWRGLWRLAHLYVALVLVAVVALGLGFQFIHAPWWPLELARYVPYLAYLLPAVAALLLSLRMGRVWRWLGVLSVTVVLTWVMDLSTGRLSVLAADLQGQPAAQASQPLRIMTYNVKAYRAYWQHEGVERLRDEMLRQDADIIVMQDANRLLDVKETRADLAPVLEGRHLYGRGQYVVASRLPIRNCAPVDLSFRDQPWESVRCIVRVGAVDVDLHVVHFITPRSGLNAARHERLSGMDDWQQNMADRLVQAERLAAQLQQRQRPAIVAGDLNAPEHSPVVRMLLETGLRDAHSAAGLGWGYSVGHALKPYLSFLRIDHVLVSPEFQVRRCETGGRSASEHRPVMADLTLTQPPAAAAPKTTTKASR